MPFAGKVFLHVVKTGAADLANITEKTPITLWSLCLHKIQIEFNCNQEGFKLVGHLLRIIRLPLKTLLKGALTLRLQKLDQIYVFSP